MLKLTPLTANTLYRLTLINRTPPPVPSLVEEVEDFVLASGAAQVLRSGRGTVLLAEAAGVVVGAAVHYPEFVAAQYVAAVLVATQHRGHGFGRELLVRVVEDARVRSGRPYVFWKVHVDNTAMLNISRSVVASGEPDSLDGDYYLFVDDPTIE